MRLISDLAYLREHYGFDPISDLLIPNIRLDAPKMATPVIARSDDGDEHVLTRQQELGNLLAQGIPSEQITLFEGYVTLDPSLRQRSSAASFAAAVAELAPSGPVHVDAGFPWSRYLALAAERDVEVDPRDDAEAYLHGAYVAHTLDADSVLQTFARLRAAGPEVAARVISAVPHLAGLAEEFVTDVDTRFSALEKLAAELGITALLSSAPPNFSELTATPPAPGTYVLWVRDTGQLHVLTPDETYGVEGRPAGRFDDLAAAVTALAGDGALGVEEHWLDTDIAQRLSAGGRVLIAGSMALGAWRDHRDAEDLPFQIIAARASRYCIEGSLAYAREQLDTVGQVSEREVHRRYRELIHEFRIEHDIPFGIEPFFVNLHASDRSLYPGPPTDHLITSTTGSVKLDAGLKVTASGVVLATSDMARSLLTTDEGREGYEFFLKVVREDIISTLEAGRLCDQVHADAVSAILDNRDRLIDLELLDPEIDFAAEYRKRNVGHLMGKQESFGIEFKPGHDIALPARSLGAAEIQWAFGRYGIGAEDMWYLGRDRTYITSM
ncbi:hypothetical protein GCM10009633_29970 [Janibacter melonis]|uniref:Xaa-Pro aminopeptidase n=1 Tax=Janibacter melonis TaxID=262209 RepID=UPI001E2A50D0|nr:Xaa-Pro aminopeptidase [Janibacter melonis]MCB5992413.1 Xaa-Pro aminopeptidase [Janibacter melonis]